MKTILLTLSIFLGSFLHAQVTEKIAEDGSSTVYNEVSGVVYFEKYSADQLLVETGAFLDGRPHGEWMRYNEEGKTIAQATYTFGSKEGRWLIWTDDATILYEINYANNEKISAFKWRAEDQQYVTK